MTLSFNLSRGDLPWTAFPCAGSHLVAKPLLCLQGTAMSCHRKGNFLKKHRWIVCTWKIPTSLDSGIEPHGAREAVGALRSLGEDAEEAQRQWSLCADNPQCLLGSPMNLLRAQGIGFLFPLPPDK